MLDKKNSLLTAISNEECATVCGGGGYGIMLNSDGSVTLNTTGSGIFQTESGQNQSVTITGVLVISPSSGSITPSFGGTNFSVTTPSQGSDGTLTYSVFGIS